MAILLMDDFRSYPTPEDMLSYNGRGGPWTTFGEVLPVSFRLINNPTWRGDGSELRALESRQDSDRHMPQRDFTTAAVPAVCAQFICGVGDSTASFTEACNFVLFQEPVIDKNTATGGMSTFYGVSVRADNGTPGDVNKVGVYYTILTSTTSNPSISRVLVGYLRPWTKGRHYHVELKVDHSNPTARIIVYVNGVLEMEATYDRDRVDNGLQTKSFKRVLLSGTSPTSSSTYSMATYSNLVIYTDADDTVFPMGPIDLTTISPTAGQGYDGLRAAPNADDTTYATVLPGATLNGTFDDLTANPNPVLAVDATVRHQSVAGIEPSQITTRIRKADDTVSGSVTTTAAPGVPATHRRFRLPAGLTAADVNGLKFQIQAAG